MFPDKLHRTLSTLLGNTQLSNAHHGWSNSTVHCQRRGRMCAWQGAWNGCHKKEVLPPASLHDDHSNAHQSNSSTPRLAGTVHAAGHRDNAHNPNGSVMSHACSMYTCSSCGRPVGSNSVCNAMIAQHAPCMYLQQARARSQKKERLGDQEPHVPVAFKMPPTMQATLRPGQQQGLQQCKQQCMPKLQ